MIGWWISPELPLVRPYTKETQKYRLDNLLKKIAKRGVKIYVLVYAEPPIFPNDSEYVQDTLTSLHSNIKVLRYPETIIPGIWSHHEKLVIIDQ